MNPKLLIIIPIIFISCNPRQVKTPPVDPVSTNDSPKKEIVTTEEHGVAIPSDTTSTDYLSYLLKSEKDLNAYWTKKLNALDGFYFLHDTMSHLSINRSWVINDSISAIILSYATGVSFDEYLLIVKNKNEIVSNVHIKDAADADVTENNKDYYYTEYQLVDNRKVKLFNHVVFNYDTDKEKDSISIENWTVLDNGKAIKK